MKMKNRMIAQGVSLDELPNSNQNQLIVGSSGSGKTGSFLTSCLMAANGESIVVSDCKQNLYRKFLGHLVCDGYQVYNLNLVDPDQGCGYDPLDYIRCEYKNGKRVWNQKDILTISSVLCPLDPNEREPFWTQQAQMVISILIAYVLTEMNGKERNLASILDVFRAMCDTADSGEVPFLSDYCVKYPDSFAARRYQMISGCFKADKTWASIKFFVANALSIFEFDAAREMLSKRSSFSLHDLGRKPTVCFVNVSDTDRSLDPIANCFYTQIMNILCSDADREPDSKLAVPVRLILDDFASNVYIPFFDKFISVVRSRNISITCMIQALSQLNSYYGVAKANTIINNCSTLYFLGGQDLDTVGYLSQRANIPPEDIMCLPNEMGILLRSGEKPLKVRKIKPYSMMKELEEEQVEFDDDQPEPAVTDSAV